MGGERQGQEERPGMATGCILRLLGPRACVQGSSAVPVRI